MTRKPKPYTPRAGSHARQILDWMRARPETHIYASCVLYEIGDICRPSNVANVMTHMVAAGLVKRYREPGTNGYCYSLADQPHLEPRPWPRPLPKKCAAKPKPPEMHQTITRASVAELPRVEILPGVFA